jgi:hypothetical protein
MTLMDLFLMVVIQQMVLTNIARCRKIRSGMAQTWASEKKEKKTYMLLKTQNNKTTKF